MFSKKILHFGLVLLMFTTFTGYSQVITSKKQAVKKGVYQKPDEKEKLVTVLDKKAKNTKSNLSKKYSLTDTDEKDIVFTQQENYLALQIINNAMTFVGVKYHWGGTTLSGMDCSGMVTAIFDIFDMKLPRSSNEMAKLGKKMDSKDIQKGDLIFFKTNGRSMINHVGMVVEVIGDEIKFIHSSTNKGVIVSSTKEPYYNKSFAQVNRIL